MCTRLPWRTKEGFAQTCNLTRGTAYSHNPAWFPPRGFFHLCARSRLWCMCASVRYAVEAMLCVLCARVTSKPSALEVSNACAPKSREPRENHIGTHYKQGKIITKTKKGRKVDAALSVGENVAKSEMRLVCKLRLKKPSSKLST